MSEGCRRGGYIEESGKHEVIDWARQYESEEQIMREKTDVQTNNLSWLCITIHK